MYVNPSTNQITVHPQILPKDNTMKNVLIVDDNTMMRKVIITLFREDNLHFEEAVDGQEALDKMAQVAYDLVITDIIMPRMEGTELIMEIRKRHPETGIIAISGGKPYYLYVAKKLGVSAVFTKPLNPSLFRDTVHQMLQFHKDSLHKAS
jgi:YesN/AraC family two-component response regulator